MALSLIVLSNGPLFFVTRKVFGIPDSWEGPFVRPMIVATVATAIVVVLLDPYRRSGQRLRSPSMVALASAVGLGCWAALSTLWSLQPEITLWRGVVYAGLPFVAWVIADLGRDDLARAVALFGAAVVVPSVGFVIVWSSVATDSNDDWRGVMTNRNGFAPICGLAILAAMTLLSGTELSERRRRLDVALLGLAGVGLLGSGSRTAWFALVLALGVATVVVVGRYEHIRSPRRGVLVASAVAVGAGSVGSVLALARVWNESTFVQRRTIWDLVGDRVSEHPIGGVGWEAFWYTPELHTHELLTRGSAHGSIPELLLGVGVVGLVLWAIVVGLAIFGVVRAAWRNPSTETWFWLAAVTFLVVENLTESFVLWFSYNWVLLIAAALRFGGRRPRPTARRNVEAMSTAIG